MISIYNLRKNTLGEEPTLQVELRGLSTDTKPISLQGVSIENGSVFIEIDTQALYLYDGETKEWITPSSEDEQEENEETPEENNEDNNRNEAR